MLGSSRHGVGGVVAGTVGGTAGSFRISEMVTATKGTSWRVPAGGAPSVSRPRLLFHRSLQGIVDGTHQVPMLLLLLADLTRDAGPLSSKRLLTVLVRHGLHLWWLRLPLDFGILGSRRLSRPAGLTGGSSMVRGSWTHEMEGLGFRARIILILAAIVALITCCCFFNFGVHRSVVYDLHFRLQAHKLIASLL